jgi:hypothetical protein
MLGERSSRAFPYSAARDLRLIDIAYGVMTSMRTRSARGSGCPVDAPSLHVTDEVQRHLTGAFAEEAPARSFHGAGLGAPTQGHRRSVMGAGAQTAASSSE